MTLGWLYPQMCLYDTYSDLDLPEMCSDVKVYLLTSKMTSTCRQIVKQSPTLVTTTIFNVCVLLESDTRRIIPFDNTTISNRWCIVFLLTHLIWNMLTQILGWKPCRSNRSDLLFHFVCISVPVLGSTVSASL